MTRAIVHIKMYESKAIPRRKPVTLTPMVKSHPETRRANRQKILKMRKRTCSHLAYSIKQKRIMYSFSHTHTQIKILSGM